MIDLKLTIQKLETENLALRTKMSLMYSNWKFDSDRFMELKEKCKNDNKSDDDEHIQNKTIRRSVASNNLGRMI